MMHDTLRALNTLNLISSYLGPDGPNSVRAYREKLEIERTVA